MSEQHQPPAAIAGRSRLGKRLAIGMAIVVVCYLAVAYLIIPWGWHSYGERHPSFDDNPRLTETGDGHPGDAINVALTGTATQLKAIMLAADWYPADALGLRSDARIAVDTVLERPYQQAPVSKLYLYGRPEDFAFEQAVGDDPRHRHHVRFWRSKQSDQDRPIWVGSATYDQRVGLSHTTGQITHHTAADIDTERAHVFETLERTGDLTETYKVPGFHQQLTGINGGGDPWHTDGALWVGVINKKFDIGRDQPSGAESTSSASVRAVTPSVLLSDLRVLQSSGSQLEQVVAEMKALAKSAPWRAGGFFDAPQQDQVEHLLFRYLACRHALWDLANHHQDNDARFSDAQIKAMNSVIAMAAGFRLVLSDASLVSAFGGDPVAVDKLNEEFYRSRIPARTYERLSLGVTNEAQIRALNHSLLLFTAELNDPDSVLSKLVRQDPIYGKLVDQTRSVAQQADHIIQTLVASESRIAPTLDNELRHTRVAELMRGVEAEGGGLLVAARAHLFKGISRIKNPESHLIRFSPQQKRQVYDLLEPGDIILTYTAGYISDIFIPGSFKHAITYVGSPEDREIAGLTADRLDWLPQSERQTLLQSVAEAKLPSGLQSDVIESVGEGVIFNHLGYIMDTHINRMLVLRPQVSHEQRTVALANVFLFLGDEYDFKFDFADASRQVCTEVVYRALDGKGPVEFTLVERAGHETLSADDIANNYLAKPGEAFDFVLLVEGVVNDPSHRAQVILGDPGKLRLQELMSKTDD